MVCEFHQRSWQSILYHILCECFYYFCEEVVSCQLLKLECKCSKFVCFDNDYVRVAILLAQTAMDVYH